jgi:hypothetical protein
VCCTLRPPEPPRGRGSGVPAASALLCVSDRLGGMPHCGRLRDGPLRPPLPRRYDETVARGSAAEEHLDIRRQARDGRRGGDCGSFCGGIAAVACCLPVLLWRPHSRRAAGGACGRDMGLGVAQMVAQVPVVRVQRRRARWRALLECAEAVRVRAVGTRGVGCATPQALSWRVACPWDSESRQSAL